MEQETRRWDDARAKHVMRSKRCAGLPLFPEPDLLTFEVSEAHVQDEGFHP
ncbi:MAG: hypothetical protein ACLR7U_05060 [Ruthenibacterium lactatiformans]